ncbi:unnamed protein product [Gongylonema pulchrum]|uniref:EGF-like domain-containing protein n=1 Tax=Gongylonema pulchrum TaxID=637853 RepID=A0A183D7E0_9BILA|nr:unnamed protein product [Gongylonema pulchrum]
MTRDRICVDIDECEERGGRQCSEHATCDGYTCIPAAKRQCNEDELSKSDCGRDHLCLIDDKGRIDCDSCKKGFVREESGGCTDINECLVKNACHPDAFCKNMMGSYSCHCQPGFRGDGHYCVGLLKFVKLTGSVNDAIFIK